MRWSRTGRFAWPARWSRRAGAFPKARGRSCRRLPWSRRARISCRTISRRYPHARLQRALAGVDQIHHGEPFAEGADRAVAVDGGKVHGSVTFVPFTRVVLCLTVDGEAPAEHVGLDRLVRQIDPYLADPGLIQIIHMYLNCLRPLHLEQEI